MPASPFRDPNLHLAVLDTAWDQKLLLEPEKTWVAPHPRTVDRKALDMLLATELPARVLETIESFSCWCGRRVSGFIVEEWDGEDDTFEVTDLTGIVALRNLRILELFAARLTDISALRGLDRLEVFQYTPSASVAVYSSPTSTTTVEHTPTDADSAGQLADLRPLLELPALRRVSIGSKYRNDERNRGVLKELQRRGVDAPTAEELLARREAERRTEVQHETITKGLAAFAAKNYAEAAQLLGRYEDALEGSQRLKLAFARKQAARS